MRGASKGSRRPTLLKVLSYAPTPITNGERRVLVLVLGAVAQTTAEELASVQYPAMPAAEQAHEPMASSTEVGRA